MNAHTPPAPIAALEAKPAKPTPLETGVGVIKRVLATLPDKPGVYRMLGAGGEVLYVGKALSLKRRVASYTRLGQLNRRISTMVGRTAAMEIVVTGSEAEALLLEANYIRQMQPHFNILLKDDKSYPWLVLEGGHDFPRLSRHRGKKQKGAWYWGPFASTRAAQHTQQALERSFGLRTCSDAVFNARTRPCLLHQIKRCSAPCVGRISQSDYRDSIAEAKAYLADGGQALQRHLHAEMEKAAEALAFERAAALRDRLRALGDVRRSGAINPSVIEEADIFGLWQAGGQTCIQVVFIRGGRNNGNRPFFPVHDDEATPAEIMASFMLQFYSDKTPPRDIHVNIQPAEPALLEEALGLQREGRVRVTMPQRGEKRAVVEHAERNARETIERHLAESAAQKDILERVGVLFNLPHPPARIETYDNSHISGQAPYGVMVVGGPEGFMKRAYRKYAIRGPVTAGDDFAMMREVMERRFGHVAKMGLEEARKADWPDLLLIDGGAGQVSAVQAMLAELGVEGVPIVGIAKGPDRNAGREWFVQPGRVPFQLPPHDPVLYHLQRLRDEAHRFAITTHRAKRSRMLVHSALDDIPGIGPARKKALLARFGSARGVRNASLDELAQTPGLSGASAQSVYGYFHPEWIRDSAPSPMLASGGNFQPALVGEGALTGQKSLGGGSATEEMALKSSQRPPRPPAPETEPC
ncbi:excinuclease ABC subunit UvrC [Formicincola oecophyllae]|uniref:UvrABC system protein C n=1 Tax=Formicincola oecophyllae TaxID=2558361 RepID=A0A4Y6U944_9PROT|nr:excinuclease ABC subunit UvrC [Formicincola oecophyllae]QDH13979.1 excinuclease ABC subunit UvrC [Formicincola oecophyllae]